MTNSLNIKKIYRFIYVIVLIYTHLKVCDTAMQKVSTPWEQNTYTPQ